jgi:membrane-associated phospholipid phosphatase
MDAAAYRAVNRLSAHTAWMHWLFIAVAKYGIVLFALALVMAWWIARRSGPEAVAAVVWAGAIALGALGLAQVIGGAVDRARPYTAMPTAHVLISRTTDFSFPSDHAAVSGAVAAGLLVAARRCDLRQLAGTALAIAVLMAFSRVYVGVHYPSDVLAGLALGAGVAVVGAPLARRLLDPLPRRLADTPLRPLVMDQVGALA